MSWRIRVTDELMELTLRVNRLTDFLHLVRDVPEPEQSRLKRQLGVMIEYQMILRERIEAGFR